MAFREKGQPESRPNPNSAVNHDAADFKGSRDFAQALARSVFGRDYIVVHEPIGKRFRTRARPRIRSWRAAQ
jgi:hypothetical protein